MQRHRGGLALSPQSRSRLDWVKLTAFDAAGCGVLNGPEEDRAQNGEPKTLSVVSAILMARRDTRYGYAYAVLGMMTMI
jgi:hypothetical protein